MQNNIQRKHNDGVIGRDIRCQTKTDLCCLHNNRWSTPDTPSCPVRWRTSPQGFPDKQHAHNNRRKLEIQFYISSVENTLFSLFRPSYFFLSFFSSLLLRP